MDSSPRSPGPAFLVGVAAEARTAEALERRGWQIITRNWRGGGGELDLVAWRADELRFVEVKARRAGDPRADDALTPRKQARLRLAAKAWLALNPAYERLAPAFLVAFVDTTLEPWEIRWLDNAFDG